MTDLTKRLVKLLHTVQETGDDWSVLSVEDAVAVTVAGLIYSEASTKWPDLYSDIYHRAAKERSDQAELVERMNQTPVQ